MATIKHTYLGWAADGTPEADYHTTQLVVVGKRIVPSSNPFLSIGIETYYPQNINPEVGDSLEIIYDFTIPLDYWDTDDDGNKSPDHKFISHVINYNIPTNVKKILISAPHSITVDDVINGLADPTKAMKIYVPKLKLNTVGSDIYVADDPVEITFIDSPYRIVINGKLVKSLAIGGHDFEDLTIDGHKYSFSNDVTVTQADVEKLVLDNTTWTPPTGLIISGNDYTSIEPGINGIGISISGYAGFTGSTQGVESLTMQFKTATTIPNNQSFNIFNFDNNNDPMNLDRIVVLGHRKNTVNAAAGDIWRFDANGETKLSSIPLPTATIDTTAKLQGLDVTYSKSTGITDGESIDATVVFDASLVDSINGKASDFVVSGIVISNPSRTVTQDEVETFVKANLSDTGLLNVTGWPALHPGTKLYTPNLHIIKDTDIVYTVQADDGFTINGGATVDYTINIPDKTYEILISQDSKGLYKIENDALVQIDSNDVSYGFAGQVSDGTVYVGTHKVGLKKLVNDALVDVDSTNVNGGYIYQLSDGTIYMGGSNGTLKLENDKLVYLFSTSRGMLETSDGTLLIWLSDGVHKIVNDKLVSIPTGSIDGGSNLIQLKDGSIYALSQHGIQKYENNIFTIIDPYNAASGKIIQLNNGTVLIAFDTKIQKLENDKLVDYISTIGVGIYYIIEAHDGTIYVSTTDGIKKLENDKLVDYISSGPSYFGLEIGLDS